jgi:hypothetical protein
MADEFGMALVLPASEDIAWERAVAYVRDAQEAYTLRDAETLERALDEHIATFRPSLEELCAINDIASTIAALRARLDAVHEHGRDGRVVRIAAGDGALVFVFELETETAVMFARAWNAGVLYAAGFRLPVSLDSRH